MCTHFSQYCEERSKKSVKGTKGPGSKARLKGRKLNTFFPKQAFNFNLLLAGIGLGFARAFNQQGCPDQESLRRSALWANPMLCLQLPPLSCSVIPASSLNVSKAFSWRVTLNKEKPRLSIFVNSLGYQWSMYELKSFPVRLMGRQKDSLRSMQGCADA